MLESLCNLSLTGKDECLGRNLARLEEWLTCASSCALRQGWQSGRTSPHFSKLLLVTKGQQESVHHLIEAPRLPQQSQPTSDATLSLVQASLLFF